MGTQTMKRANLTTAGVDELVQLFIDLCIEQDRHLLEDDISEVNRLFDKIDGVKNALKTMPGDQRHALIPLYEHPNMQVRLKAAKATLAIAPDAARRTLEAISAANWPPQSLDAGMCLWTLDRGIFKPT